MSADFPLTPTEAIAFAALGEAHIAEKAGLPAVADLIPRWKSWADRLRRWGEANLIGDDDVQAFEPITDWCSLCCDHVGPDFAGHAAYVHGAVLR